MSRLIKLIIYCNYSTAVRCAKVVTQKPSVLTEEKGRSVTMDCNIEKDEGYYVSWYKQIPNTAPQFVLRYYHSHSAPSYGDGFTSSRFTSKAQSNIDYRLIISNVDVDDSAVYYCQTYYSSVTEVVSQWFTAWQKPPHCSHSLLLLDNRSKEHYFTSQVHDE